MADGAGYFTDHIVRAVLLNPKMVERKDSNLAKICDYAIQGLNVGLSAEEKITFLSKLDSLRDKTIIFGYYVSAGNADNLYSSYVILTGRNLWGKIGHSLKKMFSLPKKRRRLNDQEFLENETRNELLEMIETSIEDGLDAGRLNDMLRKGIDAYCTTIEIKLYQQEDKSYSLEFLYS